MLRWLSGRWGRNAERPNSVFKVSAHCIFLGEALTFSPRQGVLEVGGVQRDSGRGVFDAGMGGPDGAEPLLLLDPGLLAVAGGSGWIDGARLPSLRGNGPGERAGKSMYARSYFSRLSRL
jgi:hypothetical protein